MLGNLVRPTVLCLFLRHGEIEKGEVDTSIHTLTFHSGAKRSGVRPLFIIRKVEWGGRWGGEGRGVLDYYWRKCNLQ